jgi:hypothetical protein
MESKITKEELDLLVSLKNKQDQALYQIGAIESQKHAMLHALSDINKEVEDNKKVLEDKYGQVSINLEDGTYTEIEKE